MNSVDMSTKIMSAQIDSEILKEVRKEVCDDDEIEIYVNNFNKKLESEINRAFLGGTKKIHLPPE